MKKIIKHFARFRKDKNASLAVVMGLSMIPATGFAGAAIDYSRAMRAADQLQIAIDAATLSGAILALSNREDRSKAVFNANISDLMPGAPATATFATKHDPAIGSIYVGTARATIETAVMKVMGINSITITSRSNALFGTGDNSCILTLGGELDLDDETMTFNGSPNINLAGCTIRSNKSIKCNGHSTGAIASIAAGNVTNCPNPASNAGIVPDIYAAAANNIEKKCGAIYGSVSWDGTSVPTGGDVMTFSRPGYKEIHVCGTLKLTGTGTLAGTGSSEDTVIVVENGNIEVTDGADLKALRTTFVISGDNPNGKFEFPNGNGKTAKLNVSSSVASGNPFAGIAIYQDPRSSQIVSATWGPGASLIVDGINYQPRTDLTLGGVAETGSSQCSKLVTYSFRINGAVSLKQDATGCKDQQVSQYSVYPRLLY